MDQTKELSRLDELIADLDDRADTPQGLMHEHLAAARSWLLEAAPAEYSMMLEMAKEALPQIESPALRSRIRDFLERHAVV